MNMGSKSSGPHVIARRNALKPQINNITKKVKHPPKLHSKFLPRIKDGGMIPSKKEIQHDFFL